MRGLRRGPAAGRDHGLRAMRRDARDPSLREAYAAVEKLAPVLKANAERRPARWCSAGSKRSRPICSGGASGWPAWRRRRDDAAAHGEPIELVDLGRARAATWPAPRPSSRRPGCCGASGAELRRAAVSATLFALGAIALWATLASLGVALTHVPPFLLTGLALVIGSVPAWPLARHWKRAGAHAGARRLRPVRLPLPAVHRAAHAPPVEANLVNYLWPLLIVVLAPVFLPGV